MPNFDSGVLTYVTGTAEIKVHFPVDAKGREDVCCYQCWYFRRNYQTCGLNGSICEYPEKYIGSMCPLNFNERKNLNYDDTI